MGFRIEDIFAFFVLTGLDLHVGIAAGCDTRIVALGKSQRLRAIVVFARAHLRAPVDGVQRAGILAAFAVADGLCAVVRHDDHGGRGFDGDAAALAGARRPPAAADARAGIVFYVNFAFVVGI